MTTNKPNVRRYDDMGSGQICPSNNMHESDDGDYVLYEDYKALQAVCDHYKNAIAEIATRHSVDRWANTSSDKELEQYLSDGIAQLESEYRKQIEALQAECEKLRMDAKRLDWIVSEGVIVARAGVRGEPHLYRVEWPQLSEVSINWFTSERDAINAAMRPSEQPECGCCGQTYRCDDDCDAVVIGGHRAAEQQHGLTEALRQYQHNDGSGLVFGYDKLLVDQHVAQLVEALEAVMEFGCDPKSNRGMWALEKAESALAAYHNQGGAI